MTPIVLTRRNGRAVYVNAELITQFYADAFETLVLLAGETMPLAVTQSPAEILGQLKRIEALGVLAQPAAHEATTWHEATT